MSAEQAGVYSYRAPHLAASVSRQGSRITLESFGRTYDIDAPDEAVTVEQFLRVLRDATSPVWGELRSDPHGSPWGPLLAELDRLGLITEDDSQVRDHLEQERQRVDDVRTRNDAWWDEALTTLPREPLREAFRQVGEYLDSCAAAAANGSPTPPATPDTASFPLAVLHRQVQRWMQSAPLSLALAAQSLRRVRRLLGVAAPAPDSAPDGLVEVTAAGLYDVADVATHLACLGTLLVAACRPDAERRCKPPREGTHTSGANLMLSGERLCLDALSQLGVSRLIGALDGPAGERVGRGVYVEQFHTTRRFVEIITPLMATRLDAPLRSAIFQYYAEEVGHEVFELNACTSLGLDASAVQSATPLPYWVAYLEVFAEIARTNPLGFLLSVVVTEGLPGAPNAINSLLSDRRLISNALDNELRKHEQVNIELDHTSLPRRLLAHVLAVTPAAATAALDDLAFMVELNFRAWNMLADYYGDSRNAPLHTAFAMSPVDVLHHGATTSAAPR